MPQRETAALSFFFLLDVWIDLETCKASLISAYRSRSNLIDASLQSGLEGSAGGQVFPGVRRELCRAADQIRKNMAWSSALDPNPDPNP
jgi:hypothetical protein